MNKDLLRFSLEFFGGLQPYNDTVSIGRCRIFYKGKNRNGSFITEQFAERLLKSLPYTPVKGMWDEEKEDFGSHKMTSADPRKETIYGVVPEKPNVKWETFTDASGKTATYACCDVLVYTTLFEEAKEIFSKSQSMELFPPSIKGDWKFIDGQKYFEFTDAKFFGLQILGDDIEPCFEGAGFFSLNEKINAAFEKLAELEKKYAQYNFGGEEEMHDFVFALSDAAKYDMIFDLLNPRVEGEDQVIKYAINEVFDDFAIVWDYENKSYYKVAYTKDEDSVTLGVKEKAFYLAVTEDEYNALMNLKEQNVSFENVGETIGKVEELESKVESFESKIAEKETAFSTLTTEKEEVEQKLVEAANTNLDLTNSFSAYKEEAEKTIAGLTQFKANIEKDQRQAILDKYASRLDSEVLAKYNVEDDVDLKELEKNLAFELVNSDPSFFSGEGKDPEMVPIDTPQTGIEAILNKYKNNK